MTGPGLPVPAEAAAGSREPGRGAGRRPSPLGWVARGLLVTTAAGAVLLIPLGRPPSDVRLFTQAAVYGVIGLSLNVLLGYAGQISLGHQAFVGIGAFASAYVVTVQRLPFAVAVVVAMVVGGVQALVLGAVALRITGLYFAVVTLAYGTVAEQSLFEVTRFTGGGAGQAAPLPTGLATPHRYYYLCLGFLAAALWVDVRMMRTRAGRAMLAVREDPRVAASFGVDVAAYTLLAFVVSGAMAGTGGALLAHAVGLVQARDYDFRLALVFVIMTVVGGLGSRAGVVAGSAVFALLGYVIEKGRVEAAFGFLAAHTPVPFLSKEIAPLVLGPLLLLLTLTVWPGGIGQQLRPLGRWLRGGPLLARRPARDEVGRGPA